MTKSEIEFPCQANMFVDSIYVRVTVIMDKDIGITISYIDKNDNDKEKYLLCCHGKLSPITKSEISKCSYLSKKEIERQLASVYRAYDQLYDHILSQLQNNKDLEIDTLRKIIKNASHNCENISADSCAFNQ